MDRRIKIIANSDCVLRGKPFAAGQVLAEGALAPGVEAADITRGAALAFIQAIDAPAPPPLVVAPPVETPLSPDLSTRAPKRRIGM